jgi:RNA polymerase sigma-70 factor (ECF subfamily)
MLESYTVRAVRRFNPNGDTSIAKDIVQEILLAIHAKRHTYHSTQRFLPWVFGIARHKLIDWQRKYSSEKRALDFEFEMDEIVSSELSNVFSPDGQPSSGLHSLLEKLNPKQREVIELTKIHGLSIAETAKRTGMSEANVKVLTHRGILTLRKMLEEEQNE